MLLPERLSGSCYSAKLMSLTTGGGDLLEEAAGGVCCGQAGSALPHGHP